MLSLYLNSQKKDKLYEKNRIKQLCRNYYITKDTINGTPQATSPGSKDDILIDTHKSDSHANSTNALVSPNNIINNISENFNSSNKI